MTDDKSGEDKLFEGDNAQEEKVSPEDSTGAPAVIKPVQAEIIPDVPIAKLQRRQQQLRQPHRQLMPRRRRKRRIKHAGLPRRLRRRQRS